MRFDLAAMARRAGVRRGRVVLTPITARKSIEAGLYRAFLVALREGETHRAALLRGAADLRAELTHDAGLWELVRMAFRAAYEKLARIVEDMIRRHLGMSGARHSARWIQQVNAAIGVNLSAIVSSKDIAPAIELATARNVALIKGLTDELAKRIETTILDMVSQGKANAAIEKALGETFGFGRNRAKLIARDQAAKFNAALNRIRQQQAGITEYVWWTVLDERVRGNPSGKYPRAKPSHWDRHGKTFRWSASPADGAPGEPINCRCIARPVIT